MKTTATLILALGLMLSAAAVACDKHHPAGGESGDKMARWQSCEYVTDCSLGQTSCVGPVVVSKALEAQYLEWVKANEPTVQCVRFFSPREVTLSCEEKRCKIKGWKE